MVRPVVLAERDIESVHTQVIVQTFSDRVLVIVTQLQKVGTLIQASVPATVALADTSPDDFESDAMSTSLPPVHPSIDLTYLFGNAPSPDHQTLYSSYAPKSQPSCGVRKGMVKLDHPIPPWSLELH
ncbi:hypothetical protein BJV77DRAFT_1065567 [Russula vinacea]|nr:hypothetical protein BJV77DRAFT_1065567 [Russula vinacea]